MQTSSSMPGTARLDASASCLAALCVGLLLSSVCLADELAESPLADDAAVTPALVEAPELLIDLESTSAFESVDVLSETELTEQRAKANIELGDITINTTDQNGVVDGNTASGNQTGNNSIADGAFVGSDGFISTVQNTGNNVLIQNATTINVSIEP